MSGFQRDHMWCGDVEDNLMLLKDELKCAEDVIIELRGRIVALESRPRQRRHKIVVQVINS